MKQWHSIFLLFCAFFMTHTQANVSLTLELKDIHYVKENNTIKPTIFVGDSFELKLIISGAQNISDNITINGIEHFSVNSTYDSSNVSIINNVMHAKKTTHYTLLPTKEGTYSIGPAQVQHMGKTYSSNTINLTVTNQENRNKVALVGKPHNSQPASQPHQHRNPHLFCKLIPQKKTVVPGEPVLVTIAIHTIGDEIKISGIQPPTFPNSIVKEIEQLQKYNQQEKDGLFTVYEKNFLLFPTKPGIMQIPPAQVIYQVRKKRNHDPFSFFDENFFSAFRGFGMEQKVAASNPTHITVEPLPDNNKNIDGVGTFTSFTAILDKTNVIVNEPMKLILSLNGQGNLDQIIAPTLSLPQSFKSYDSKVETSQDLSYDYRGGTKQFEFILQAPQAGTWTIEPQKFTYFDTKAKQYKTLKTKLITVTATLPSGQQTQHLNNITTPFVSEKPVSQDIHFIQEDVAITKKNSKHFSLFFFILLLLLTPIAFFFTAIKPILLPLFAYLPISRKNIIAQYQKQLKDIVAHNKLEKLYSLFINFLAELSGEDVTFINETWIEHSLATSGLSSKEIEDFINFINTCAQFSFSFETNTDKNSEELFKQSKYWLLIIYKHIQRKG